MKFGKENAHKKILHSRITLIGLLIVAVFMLSSVYERYTIERQTLHKTEAMQAQLEALDAHQADLAKKVHYLQGGQGIEEEIRRNFDVAKPGEQVVILTGAAAAATTASTTPPPPPRPWYRFW